MDLSKDSGALMDIYSDWGALMDLSKDWGALLDLSSNGAVTLWFVFSHVSKSTTGRRLYQYNEDDVLFKF